MDCVEVCPVDCLYEGENLLVIYPPGRMHLSDEKLAREIFRLSEGLIGEIVAIVTTAAVAAARSGAERITKTSIDELDYVPVSRRRGARQRDGLL